MSTDYWGPLTWTTLHCLTYNYPPNPSRDFRKKTFYFFNYIIPSVLPCPKCQKHFLKQLRDNPITYHLGNRESLCQWLIEIHNYVNRSNRKKNYSKDEIDQIYENKIYINDIQKLIFFLRQRVQYGSLSPNWYNQFMYYLNGLLLRNVPTNNCGQV